MLCLWHLFVPDIVRCVWIPDEDGDEGDVVTGVGGQGVLEAEEGGGIGIINVVNIGKQLKYSLFLGFCEIISLRCLRGPEVPHTNQSC